VVAAAHRGSDRRSAGDRQRVPQGWRCEGAGAGPAADEAVADEAVADGPHGGGGVGKTGHFAGGVHRPWMAEATPRVAAPATPACSKRGAKARAVAGPP
jgi:hypothetical protein